MIMDSFRTKTFAQIEDNTFEFFRLKALEEQKKIDLTKFPYSLKILLENLLRHEDGKTVAKEEIETLLSWNPKSPPKNEISFYPARVLLQDFTGVPVVVDLAAMRDAVSKMGGKTNIINPLTPLELVIDHSVQVDRFGTPDSFRVNAELEMERNKERYLLLRWGQQALNNFKVVPPDTGIVHQVNLEYLARVIMQEAPKENKASSESGRNGKILAYPDTVIGTDSHTTMVSGLGVLGWGVGGIEAEAVMLGQPITMLIPEVIGFKLTGALPPGATATDLVLTITELLRKKGVVGKLIEFFGPGISNLSLPDRATISNMSPEYGATTAIFPIDNETIRYLKLTGRDPEQARFIETYARKQELFYSPANPDPDYSEVIEFNLSHIEPCISGPKRPQDRVTLDSSKRVFLNTLEAFRKERKGGKTQTEKQTETATLVQQQIQDGSVVIAAITSCTNTSNPSVMIAAGLLAKKAVEKGLQRKSWVKTSLAPGSQVVIEYLKEAKLLPYLEKLGFYLVGFGCTTCIGNSGPLPEEIQKAIQEENLYAVSILSGNRNFEGRINPLVRGNYLASPPLVVAYALAGRMDLDLTKEPLGNDLNGSPVFLKEIWPSSTEIAEITQKVLHADLFKKKYADVFKGDKLWNSLPVPSGEQFMWDSNSEYIKSPPYFKEFSLTLNPLQDILNARVLCLLGDSITTDHISPAGSILPNTPAGKYLIEQGIKPEDFNSYGTRRGNHEVMVRGTFANNRLKNLIAPGTEGGWTLHFPEEERMSIYEAAVKYQEEKIPLIVIAGKEYGSGSSRDWAAKGVALLGVKAVIAESFERIHRSNLIGMGVLPLEFQKGESAKSLGLTGKEIYAVKDLGKKLKVKGTIEVQVKEPSGSQKSLTLNVRIDTPREMEYFRNGGILPYVLRQLL